MPKDTLWVNLEAPDAVGTQRRIRVQNVQAFPGLRERLLRVE
jgi:hypothetical protein